MEKEEEDMPGQKANLERYKKAKSTLENYGKVKQIYDKYLESEITSFCTN